MIDMRADAGFEEATCPLRDEGLLLEWRRRCRSYTTFPTASPYRLFNIKFLFLIIESWIVRIPLLAGVASSSIFCNSPVLKNSIFGLCVVLGSSILGRLTNASLECLKYLLRVLVVNRASSSLVLKLNYSKSSWT